MALIVNTNIMSLNAQRNISKTNIGLALAIQRLSSGLRINSARDDAAGLALAENATAQIRGNAVAIRNANDGISIGQVAEGALGQVAANLQRIRELAVQAANTGVDGTLLQNEVNELQAEITRIIDTTEFNGNQLLDNTTALTFQIGSDNTATHQVTINLSNLTGLNAYTAIDVSTVAAALNTLDLMDADLSTVVSARSTFGALQNRFEAVVSSLENYNENLMAARSRIMDADFAAETANLTRFQILQQAGISMLAQANATPQNVLALLA